MVQRKGMLGLVRFRMLRAGISKYSTLRLASSSGLWAASLAIPTRAMVYLRLLFAFWQEEFWGRNGRHRAHEGSGIDRNQYPRNRGATERGGSPDQNRQAVA